MRLAALFLASLVPALASAQATVSGVVRDSITRRPIAAAMVQLVPAERLTRPGRAVVADSLGRFAFDSVPDGRYALGFFHPLLDSLGLQPILREVSVSRGRSVHADLAIPAPARLRAAICSSRSTRDSSAVVVGVVRDARSQLPLAGVTVTGEWLELSFTHDGLYRQVPRVVATTGTDGWFAICNAPSAGTVALTASRAADSTDLIDVEVPADGFARRDLYLGSARVVAAPDTIMRTDSLSPPVRHMHVGDGRLRGTVVNPVGGPLAGAQVGILGGPQTRTNERGEWTLDDAPLGTRVLEFRAVTYYPEHRVVNVGPDSESVNVMLSMAKAVLDTVRVTAPMFTRDRNGFSERSRSGTGRYLTADDVAKRNPLYSSDIFTTMPGVRVAEGKEILDRKILVRAPGGLAAWCEPAIYVDGLYMFTASANDIDNWVRPEEIAGIEVYSGLSQPPVQYQRGFNACGSIVIWTRPVGPVKKLTRGRMITLLSLVALTLFTGTLLTR